MASPPSPRIQIIEKGYSGPGSSWIAAENVSSTGRRPSGATCIRDWTLIVEPISCTGGSGSGASAFLRRAR